MSFRLFCKIPMRPDKLATRISVRTMSSSLLKRSVSVVHANTPALLVPQRLHQFADREQQQQQQVQRRWMTTAKPDASEDVEEDEEDTLLYEGPMKRMITTLKVFSLSSAVLSTIGLPGMMLVKGIDMYTTVHIMMVGTTVMGSIGSTLGLQYIFAPYVYTLERIPRSSIVEPAEENSADGNEEAPTAAAAAAVDTNADTPKPIEKGDFLLKATTRSVFAMNVIHIFDPQTDITGVPGGTIRPFCSFFANGKPLYIHEQMIQDPKLCQNLFIDNATPIKQHKNPDPDDDLF